MSGFSTEELAAIPDDQLVEAILGVVWASGAGLDEATVVKILDSRWYDLPEVEPMLVAYLRASPESVWEADD